jgi:hypothetical protein
MQLLVEPRYSRSKESLGKGHDYSALYLVCNAFSGFLPFVVDRDYPPDL